MPISTTSQKASIASSDLSLNVTSLKTSAPISTNQSSCALIEDINADNLLLSPTRQLILNSLHTIQKEVCTPSAQRSSAQAALGLWSTVPSDELISQLSHKDAEILLLRHAQSKEIFGFMIYQQDRKELVEFDRKAFALIDKGIASNQALADFFSKRSVGLCFLVAVSPRASLSLAEGGLGISRRQAYKLMHAAMISELDQSGVDLMICEAMVNSQPNLNQAIKAHLSCGWKLLDLPLYETTDYETNLPVKWAIFALEIGQQAKGCMAELEAALKAQIFKGEDNDPDGIDLFPR